MLPQSPIPSPRFGRTVAIAAAILAAVAVFQLGAVTVAFFKNSGRANAESGEDDADKPPLKIDISKLVVESPPPEDPALLTVDPLAAGNDGRPPGPQPVLPRAEPLIPTTEGAAPPRPTPVPLTAFTPKTDPRYPELVEQGKLLRGSGDTAGALVKFRGAEAIEPGNPLALAEQAYTFEMMGLMDKAAEQWKRILSMGERAGVYFSAAKAKLDTAVKGAVRATVGGGPAIPQGKVMAIGSTGLTEEQDAAAAKKFTLTVPVRAGTAESISVRDMKVFVLFYERMSGKEVARTIANVSNRWSSPPVDWKEGDTEILEVTYELLAQQARTEKREYYGYIVRLYYRGELQDTKAEPVSLNQKFPPPYTLSD